MIRVFKLFVRDSEDTLTSVTVTDLFRPKDGRRERYPLAPVPYFAFTSLETARRYATEGTEIWLVEASSVCRVPPFVYTIAPNVPVESTDVVMMDEYKLIERIH